jgi:integrase
MLKVNVHSWDARSIDSIASADVATLLRKIVTERGPYTSNRTRAALRVLFGWAVGEGKVTTNPVAGVKPVGEEQKRDRVLTDAELVTFWHGTAKLAYPWAAFLQVLALTAQRCGEVAWMRRRDLVLDGEKPMWTLPREATKADRIHDVPLSPWVVEILKTTPKHDKCDFVFTTDGKKPINSASQLKVRLDKKMAEVLREAAKETGDDPAKVEAWRFHDLRRTATSGMARLGTAPHVAAAVLNHAPASSQGVTSIYNRYRYGDERRAALTAWARYVEALVHPPASNVVPMTAAQ